MIPLLNSGKPKWLTASPYKFTLCEEMNRRFLTDFELMILLAILRLADEAYGVTIAKEIERVGPHEHAPSACERTAASTRR